MLHLRAVRWWRDLGRLGVAVPLFVVHDIGLLYAAESDQLVVRPRSGLDAALERTPQIRDLVVKYHALVQDISEGSARAQGAKLNDDVLVVLLARTLAAVGAACELPPPWPATIPLDVELVRGLDAELPELFAATSRAYDTAFLKVLLDGRLRVLTLLDALDVDTLRFLGTFNAPSAAAGALAHVDLLAALSTPTANDVVDFSLELLPAVLETRRARAVGTHPAHGYGGIGRQGAIDSMVLTELAWDEEELGRRMLDGELLYFTREQEPESAARLHHVLIDASASMRGDREVFARGLAIALAKKLQLGGEEVCMRFFDSRLYEVHRLRGRSELPAAWLLGFRGERGRNPSRVFAQLSIELSILRSREPRNLVVHLITHAALRVPRPLVQEVRNQAHLLGVFIVPDGGALDLDWLDLTEGYRVVDHATLQHRAARARAAAEIVDTMGRVHARAPGPNAPLT